MLQDWEETYRAAVLETEHDKLTEKVDLAITVIRWRLSSSSPEQSRERQRMEDALRTLDLIRRVEFRIPV